MTWTPDQIHDRRTYVESSLGCHEQVVRLYVPTSVSAATGERRCLRCGRRWPFTVRRLWVLEYEAVAHMISWANPIPATAEEEGTS